MGKKNYQPTASMLVIGNEILSGRTQDTNSNFLAQALTEKGINLSEIRIVPDTKKHIISAVNELRHKFDYVFTSGGIGPTHDDITADSIAEAFSVELKIRDDARKLIASNYQNGEKDLNSARLRMARIPEGALLIENRISKAPGFYLSNVFVMAGVPSIFQVMVEWLLPHLSHGNPTLSVTLRVDRPEGEIAEILEGIAENFEEVSIGSYPFSEKGSLGTNIVVRHYDTSILSRVKAEILASIHK